MWGYSSAGALPYMATDSASILAHPTSMCPSVTAGLVTMHRRVITPRLAIMHRHDTTIARGTMTARDTTIVRDTMTVRVTLIVHRAIGMAIGTVTGITGTVGISLTTAVRIADMVAMSFVEPRQEEACVTATGSSIAEEMAAATNGRHVL